ncbi:MAG: hypothetical protein JXJ17_15225 [Anaerolineae bacterium]|nr:hypothetical protein [Anaerolineae bacterium]
MSTKAIQIIVPLVIILHGVGHVMGILTAANIVHTDTWNSRSWLLTNTLGDTPARMIALVLWIVTVVGFIAAGAGAFGWPPTAGNWRTITVVMAIISLVTLAVYWNAFAVLIPNKIGSIVVNLAVLYGVFIASWPSVDVIP